MINIEEVNIDSDTIRKVGLKLSTQKINASIRPDARIFEYPHLDNVFIMENDLYGRVMPKDSCFLAFYGSHGLIGKNLKVETLRNASVEDISNIVEKNIGG